MFGHGVFVYDPREAKAKHGTWDNAAKAIADLDMSHAWLRVHSKDGLWRTEENKSLQAALKARGVSVFAWGWCDGNSVDTDVANVERALAEFAPDGYVADIEHTVAGANWTASRIRDFCARARALIGAKPFLVSTFGFLPYHEPELMRAAEPHVDAFAPQVYWFRFPNGAMLDEPGANGQYALNDAAAYTRLCIDVWRHVVAKPLVVTGQAYWGEASGWTQALAERKIAEFIGGFDGYADLAGLNWWHFAGDKAMSAGMAAAIKAARLGSRLTARPAPLDGGPPPPPPGPAIGEIAYVRADELNLRTEPGDDPSSVIVPLDIGQEVHVLGESGTAGWKKISVEVRDRMYEGHVFAEYLRQPESAHVEALLRASYEEWFRFQRGRGAEQTSPFAGYIGDMWHAIGIEGRDGTDTEHPWSAAFISWVVRKAGYPSFAFSGLHATYIHEAIRRRRLRLDGPYWGFHLHEHRPALGDLVCQWRSTPIDYEFAEDHDEFSSHCDVVVQVNQRSIRTIGGNTGQELGHTGSVSMKTYRLASDGHLIDENRLFAILRNNPA